MLLSGEIDALISPDIPRPFIAGDPRIRRLFANYKNVEVEYFRRTGLFPIMHVTVIREEILQRHPWVAASLVKAFNDSKQLAYQRICNPRVMPLAWFGPDPWAYGLGETNCGNIETISRYAFHQGVIKKQLTVGDLFAHTDTDKLRLTGAY
jgi:4,5-dihydroxyphthalate decarboxylase